ncbi:hypothetical protein [Pseudoalteromonas marina]|uniref:Uncharacterized protein n=1 Tax=Pseudoalteromonas marina TaxID=267375 RepID=A0ABT9FI20_9GAMM|nr:hypothetical protein [Pseudoalteromonas marina]MDP2566437.1 hypothetical protein [Pseudoalteromonas marina]
MNNNQVIFSAVTGFEASYKPMGSAQEYDTTDFDEIHSVVEGTVDNADLIGLEVEPAEVDVNVVAKAVYDFHNYETGQGFDLDCIFNSLA